MGTETGQVYSHLSGGSRRWKDGRIQTIQATLLS